MPTPSVRATKKERKNKREAYRGKQLVECVVVVVVVGAALAAGTGGDTPATAKAVAVAAALSMVMVMVMVMIMIMIIVVLPQADVAQHRFKLFERQDLGALGGVLVHEVVGKVVERHVGDRVLVVLGGRDDRRRPQRRRSTHQDRQGPHQTRHDKVSGLQREW
jgi:hypothetical protein